MKNLRHLMALLMVCLLSTGFTSCGDDDDEPDNPTGSGTGTVTNFGIVAPTGVHTISLFYSAQNGETVFLLPGFAPNRLEADYNIYKHVVVRVYIYSDDEGNEYANWEPGRDMPTNWYKKESGNVLVRTKVKNSDDYVYAYLERVRYLEESTGGMAGNVIGAVYKYQSPIDPLTFKGFTEN